MNPSVASAKNVFEQNIQANKEKPVVIPKKIDTSNLFKHHSPPDSPKESKPVPQPIKKLESPFLN